MSMEGQSSTPAEPQKFPRREVATRRVEWIIKPPDKEVGESDYDRYENDRMEVMRIIDREFGHVRPHDLRLIEGETETVISYEVGRLLYKDGKWVRDDYQR